MTIYYRDISKGISFVSYLNPGVTYLWLPVRTRSRPFLSMMYSQSLVIDRKNHKINLESNLNQTDIAYPDKPCIDTGSRWLTTYLTDDCLTLRPAVRLKDDYNDITQNNIRKVIITKADLRPDQLMTGR